MPPKILWTPSNPGRAQYLNPADIGIGSASSGNNYTFRPGEPNPQGNVFNNWPNLVAAYQQETLANPTRAQTISFDNSLASISIPHIPGLVFTALTSFVSAVPAIRVPVTIQNATRWFLAPDSTGRAKFNTSNLAFTRDPGPSTDSFLEELPGTTRVELDLFRTLLNNGSTLSEMYIPAGVIDLAINAVESELTASVGSPGVILANSTSADIKVRAKSILGYQTISSTAPIGTLTSEVDPDSVIGSQPTLNYPTTTELNGPAASLNVRPGPNYVLLCRDQLNLAGAQNIPQILQAFLFSVTSNVSDNDAFVITDGTTSETFTFKLAPAAPFEVLIGATRLGTLNNLAASITSDSTLWKGALVQNPITDQVGVAIIRVIQGREFYNDRAYAAGPFASGSPFVGSFRSADGTVKLTYAQPDLIALPATDPGYSMAGFSTVSPLADGTLVSVIDGLSDGIYQALNPIGGAGFGTWQYMCSPSDPTVVVNGAGTTPINRQARLIVVTLGAVDNQVLALTPFFPVGIPLLVRRTDVTAGTLTLNPVTGTIDGAASVALSGATGGIYAFDGTNWHTIAKS